MQCANCERPTPETAAFCNHCGTRLVETCRNCSSHNPLDSKFCHACGIQLSEAPPDNYDQGQSSPAHPPASEDPPAPNRAPEDTPPVTSVGHIGSDLKDLSHAIQKLASDVVSYSTPRIISFSKRVKTLAEAGVAAGITQYRELADRLKSTTKKYPAPTLTLSFAHGNPSQKQKANTLPELPYIALAAGTSLNQIHVIAFHAVCP